MTVDHIARPKELLIAVMLAFGALIVDILSIIAWRSGYGDSWILILFARTVVTAVYGALFAFAYNGRGWVRYAYLVLVAIGIGRYVMIDIGLLANPFVLISVALSVTALVLWFMPRTNQWYRRHAKLRTQ